MAFTPPYDVNPDPMGDTVSEGIEKNDGNIFDIYANLNSLLFMIDSVPANGQEILEALAPVDGISSGLDAEFLGGVIYSDYSKTTHIHPLASNSNDGFMSVLDKNKLDGIAQNADANVQSDWNTTSSSHDSFIRNKPKVAKVEGAPEDGFISVFTGPLTIRGASPAEMQGLLDYYMRPEFLNQSAGAEDAGKPVVLDPTGLIHPTMIPAVPAEAIWGAIIGTLSHQTDLQDELDAKADNGHNHDSDYESSLGNPTVDGLVLSSTAAGARSWIEMSDDPVWGDIGGTLANQTDLQDELDAKSPTTHHHDSLYYRKAHFISTSAGAGDAGKPIVLGSNGQIDPSMMDVSVFYYVGSFTPVAGTEYPSTSGESHGAFWVVQGVDAGTGYTFTGGDLSGLTVNNGDFMVWASAGWSIMAGEMNPILYYRLDGSQPLTGNFQAGGFQLKDVLNAVDPQDAVTKIQLDAKVKKSGDTMSGNLEFNESISAVFHEDDGTNSIYGYSGITLGRTSNYFRHKENDVGTLYIGGSALGDADWASVRVRCGIFTVNNHDVWHEGNFTPASKENDLGDPANDGEILSSTAAGVRSWIPKSVDWGNIDGTLASQTDLQDALDAKAPTSHDHVMADISDLDFPVTSVNGKTGALTLNYSDVGALSANGKAIDSALLDGDPKSAFALSGHLHDDRYVNTGGDTMTGSLNINFHGSNNSALRLYNEIGFKPRVEGYIDDIRRGGLYLHEEEVALIGYKVDGASVTADIRIKKEGTVDIDGNLVVHNDLALIDMKSAASSHGLLRFFQDDVDKLELGTDPSGGFSIIRKDGINTYIDTPIAILAYTDAPAIPQLKGSSVWSIADERIYTDGYHPAINDLLTEIETLKQRITALGG